VTVFTGSGLLREYLLQVALAVGVEVLGHDEVRKRIVRQCSSLPAALWMFSWCPRSPKNDLRQHRTLILYFTMLRTEVRPQASVVKCTMR
jgi:uncharacterized protein YmfQ (DUF2313 family)